MQEAAIVTILLCHAYYTHMFHSHSRTNQEILKQLHNRIKVSVQAQFINLEEQIISARLPIPYLESIQPLHMQANLLVEAIKREQNCSIHFKWTPLLETNMTTACKSLFATVSIIELVGYKYFISIQLHNASQLFSIKTWAIVEGNFSNLFSYDIQ